MRFAYSRQTFNCEIPAGISRCLSISNKLTFTGNGPIYWKYLEAISTALDRERAVRKA